MRNFQIPGSAKMPLACGFSAAALLFPPVRSAEAATPGTLLGRTTAVHALTRGHSRKVVWEPVTRKYYAFWLEDFDSNPVPAPGEGMVAQRTKNGNSWTPPAAIGFDEAGSTSFDVLADGGDLIALGLSVNAATGRPEYGVRRLDVGIDGSLTPGPFNAAYVNGVQPANDHFYGSLLKDTAGYYWIAARVGDASPGTHAEVIRSTQPDSFGAWGPAGCLGNECTGAWTNPFAGMTLEQGTIAPRLLDLGGFGVGVLAYNKNNVTPTIGQLVWSLNPTGGHASWGAPLVLTTNANQEDNVNATDPTRLDDRRFAAGIDPRTGVIHVAYISRDTTDSTNGTLRWFTLSPPYRTLADKSAEQVIVPAETDGVQVAIDAKANPSRVFVTYVENKYPNYEAKLIWYERGVWTQPSKAMSVSGNVGKRRYPQMPAQILKQRIPVLIEEDDGPNSWIIRATSVRLPASS